MSVDLVQVHETRLGLRLLVERFVQVLVRGDSVRKVTGLHLEIDPGGDSIALAAVRSILSGDFHAPDEDPVTEFFPGTSPPEPVPAVLTEQEAVRYLRLDEEGRPSEAARRAFRRLVEVKRIRPARIGLRNRYAREELLRFVLHATELSGEAPQPTGK